MQAIPPTRHGPSMGTPLSEGVLRFGATQEARENLRRERSSEVEKEEGSGPQDCSLLSDVEISQEAAGESGDMPTSSSSSTSGEGRVHHHSARHRDGDEGMPQPGARSPAEDGTQSQREMILAQHAAEQHGKREQGRQEGDRATRSTRDMMGHVEGAKGGGGEAHETHGGGEPQAPRSTEKGAHAGAAGSAHGHAGDVGSASHGGKDGGVALKGGAGGSHAPARSGQAPRIGGDVIAAVVGSGLTSVDDVAPGAVADGDPTDIDAEQVDSSQEATQARLREQELKAQKTSGLGAGLSFGGDGERGRDFEEPPTPGQGFQNQRRPPGEGERDAPRDEEQDTAGEQTTGGSGSDERQSPPRETATPGEASSAEERVTDAPSSSVADVVAPHALQPDAAPAGEPEKGSGDDGTRREGRTAEVSAPAQPAVEVPSQPSLAASAPVSPPSPDRVDTKSPASLGIDWMADTEYFFFDDARHAAEEGPAPPA